MKNEKEIAQQMLKILYPDYDFPKDLLPETLMTMTMERSTYQAILDMMRTRQNYIRKGGESDENEFFNMRKAIKLQKGHKTTSWQKPFFPTVPTTAGPSIPFATQSTLPDSEGIKLSELEIDIRRLTENTAYQFEEKDGAYYAYPIAYDAVTICQSMHTKYWFLYAAIRSLQPGDFIPGTFIQDQSLLSEMKKEVDDLLNQEKKVSQLVKLFETCAKASQEKKARILFPWVRIIEQMIDNEHKQFGLQTFTTLLRLSDPSGIISTGDPLIPCFLDAIKHYMIDRNPVTNSTREAYKQCFNEAEKAGYLPSESALETHNQTRWSTVLKGLFSKHSF